MIARIESPIFIIAAVFAVAVGYGIFLPVLPNLAEQFSNDGSGYSMPWHAGGLTAVYLLAVVMFAPVWGKVSDHIGRRVVILLGLGVYGATLIAFPLVRSVELSYLTRFAGGAFGAAVLPASLALLSDSASPAQRAQRFGWVTAGLSFGFLVGPVLGGWLADSASAGSRIWQPFTGAAVIVAIAWLGAYTQLSEPVVTPPKRRDEPAVPHRISAPLAACLALTVAVMFGTGVFEVGFALLAHQTLRLDPARIGLVFAACMVAMIAVQTLLVSRLTSGRRRTKHAAAAALAVMAVGLGSLPESSNANVALLLTGLFGAGAGVLIPLLSHVTAGASATIARGAALGMQSAAASLGQAAGSATAGLLFDLKSGLPFWVASATLATSALFIMRFERWVEKS